MAPKKRSTNALQAPGFTGAVARFWTRSYASDYLGLGILIAGYILLQFHAQPFHRLFSLSNLAISFPHAEHERVPVPALFLYAAGVPLAALALWAVLLRPGTHKTHVTLLGLVVSILLTLFLTDVVKNAVGRPRPDLLDRCKPRQDTPRGVLVDWTVCTQTDHHVLHDGWRSFPSGHSSFSFAGLGYLSLVVAGQCAVYRPRADLARVLLALAPLLGAALIAISRCEDYRHDVYDVCVGSALGFAVAWGTYRRYYPSLGSRECAEPYRNAGEDMVGRKGDEEGGYEMGDFGDEERLLNGGRA